MFRLTVTDSFASAHQLREYQGQCEKLHGHNWLVEVVIEGEELNSQGLLMDFKDLKKALNKVLRELDHTFLNEHPHFKDRNPTSENLAFYIFRQIEKSLKTHTGIRVRSVTVWESERAGATYSE